MSPPAAEADNGDVHILAEVAVLKVSVDRHDREVSGIFERLRTIERLQWLLIGGGTALFTAASFFGWNILKLLGK